MSLQLRGKRVVVTGSTAGIGLATAGERSTPEVARWAGRERRRAGCRQAGRPTVGGRRCAGVAEGVGRGHGADG
jgi:NAD(P)-dependent dehydrogenase (short-subunit alcohol dehydrogenase family)